MIALLGGKYNGMYLDRDPLPRRSTLVITAGADTEVYYMRSDGIAEQAPVWAEHGLPWDVAVKPEDLRERLP